MPSSRITLTRSAAARHSSMTHPGCDPMLSAGAVADRGAIGTPLGLLRVACTMGAAGGVSPYGLKRCPVPQSP
jgi:hypothetical protein